MNLSLRCTNKSTCSKRLTPEKQTIVLIVGGDDVGTLYGAYRFAETLGACFYIHRDVVPDGRIPLELPKLDERSKPLFALCGIQPFHDFFEGPDWWNADDYKPYSGQMANGNEFRRFAQLSDGRRRVHRLALPACRPTDSLAASRPSGSGRPRKWRTTGPCGRAIPPFMPRRLVRVGATCP